ncbi:MAG: Rho GTPase activation protein [Monoraphidium minutum]|nr:MAG: Rho GTPase activation protein [Monoraphidium minutum]
MQADNSMDAPLRTFDLGDEDVPDAPAPGALGTPAARAPAAGAAPAANPPAPGDAAGAEGQQEQQAGRQRPLQQSFEALKLGSARLASMFRQRSDAAAQPPAAAAAGTAGEHDSGAEGGPGAISKLRATATGLGAMAVTTSTRLVHSAAEGFKRIAAGDPLLALCRSEPSVPQLVLACCTALVAGGGVRARALFQEAPPPDAVERMSSCVAGGRPALIPPGTSPHVIAALLKNFLLGLEEPLLTYRLLPDWISAAADLDPARVDGLLDALPAANFNVLRLLLETAHYVHANAADTDMDALALAQALAPCIAWLPPNLKPLKSPGAAAAAAADGGDAAAAAAAEAAAAPARIVPLEGDEAQAIVMVFESLINRFANIFG